MSTSTDQDLSQVAAYNNACDRSEEVTDMPACPRGNSAASTPGSSLLSAPEIRSADGEPQYRSSSTAPQQSSSDGEHPTFEQARPSQHDMPNSAVDDNQRTEYHNSSEYQAWSEANNRATDGTEIGEIDDQFFQNLQESYNNPSSLGQTARQDQQEDTGHLHFDELDMTTAPDSNLFSYGQLDAALPQDNNLQHLGLLRTQNFAIPSPFPSTSTPFGSIENRGSTVDQNTVSQVHANSSDFSDTQFWSPINLPSTNTTRSQIPSLFDTMPLYNETETDLSSHYEYDPFAWTNNFTQPFLGGAGAWASGMFGTPVPAEYDPPALTVGHLPPSRSRGANGLSLPSRHERFYANFSSADLRFRSASMIEEEEEDYAEAEDDDEETDILDMIADNAATTATLPEASPLPPGPEFVGFPPPPPQPLTREEEDRWILWLRQSGMNYLNIKKYLGMTMALSTLRGRYRTLAKPKEHRVRKPVWQQRDINALMDIMKVYLSQAVGMPNVVASIYGQQSDITLDAALRRISWKRIVARMVDRGHYPYGNAAVKRVFLENIHYFRMFYQQG